MGSETASSIPHLNKGLAEWLWLGPAVFLAHDAEEILTVEGWMRAHAADLPAVAAPLAGITTAQFATGVAVLFAGYVLATLHGVRAVKHGRRPWPFLLATGAFFANGLAHGMQAAWLGGYTPGLVTAILLSLPYGFGVFRALHNAGIVTPTNVRWIVAMGMALQVPLALLALAAGGL